MVSRREAKRIAEQDTTPYGVLTQHRNGKGLVRVTGYKNAEIIRNGSGGVILTASEMRALQER